MLIVDSESCFIPVREPEVAAVYRSSAAISMGGEDPLPSCEAYVCIVNRDQREDVFAALHVKDLKRNLIYSLTPSPGTLLPSETLLQTGFTFVEALGFSLEPVNLKYGKAMREVVLRSIPVLSSPECIEKIRNERDAELEGLERLVAEWAKEKESASVDSSSDENEKTKRVRAEREIAANAAARKLAMEKCADEKELAIRERIQPFILQVNASEAEAAERAEHERLREENEMLEKRAAELAKTVVRLKAEAEKEREKAERRIAELMKGNLKEAEAALARQELIAREKETGEKRISDLELMLAEMRQEVEGEKGRGKALAREKKTLEKQVIDLEKSLSGAISEGEDQKQSAAALRQAEERIVGLEQALSEARELAEAERFERELLVREKVAAEKRIKDLEEEMAGSAGILETSGVDSQNPGMEKRVAELERDADQLRRQLAREKTERQRLDTEKIVYEKRISEMEEALRGAGDQPGSSQGPSGPTVPVKERIAGLQRALQQAEERTEFLRLEVDRLAAAKVLAEKRLAERAPAPQEEAASSRNAGRPAVPPREEPGSPPRIVRRPPPKGAFFHVDWDLEFLEYASPEEIIEVYESMNMAQLSLEGYHSQHCSAWIVAIEKEQNRQVYVAFGLSESGRNLIYSPAKPIRSKEDFSKGIREALKFLEVVGYIPERMSLGNVGKEDALNGIPVLRDPRKRAQGS